MLPCESIVSKVLPLRHFSILIHKASADVAARNTETFSSTEYSLTMKKFRRMLQNLFQNL